MKAVLLLLAVWSRAGVVKTPVKIVPSGYSPVNTAQVSLAPGALTPKLQLNAVYAGQPVIDGNVLLAPQELVVAEEAGDVPAAEVPPAPDFAALDSRLRSVPQAKPGRLNAFLHGRRVKKALSRRVTSDEEGLLESLVQIHDKLTQGERQSALEDIDKYFTNEAGYYRQNEPLTGYYDQAMTYRKHVQALTQSAHERARARGKSPTLVAEAKAASLVLGHRWRPTALQEKDSAHCSFHAFHNAVTASAGFAKDVDVASMVRWASEKLNRKAQFKGRIAGMPGVGAGVDVSRGMGTDYFEKFSALFGLPMEKRGPPESPQQVRRWLSEGKQVLLSLRLFHHKHGDKALGHQVYLLGAYPSAVLGAWVYVVQDSGTGTTDLYTWSELKDLVSEVQLIRPTAPVSGEGF